MNLGFEEPLWDVELFGRLTLCLASSDYISLTSCLQVCVGHPLLLCLDYFGASAFSVIIYFMTIWAVPLMRNSFTTYGHLEHLNPSIIVAMGYCSRIRKNVTEKQKIENRKTNHRGHSIAILKEH